VLHTRPPASPKLRFFFVPAMPIRRCCPFLPLPACSLLGLETPWEANPGFRACEAGQVVLDRLRHRDVLEYLWLLNTHSNSGIPGQRQGVVGQCLWGDKVSGRG
jgi:hypothetical protein